MGKLGTQPVDLDSTSSTISNGTGEGVAWFGAHAQVDVRTNGSSRYTGSSTIDISTRYRSWRAKNSVIVLRTLAGTPLRLMKAAFMCDVVTFSAPRTHSPVEKPSHVCSAYGEGCGRPSIQMVRSAFPNRLVMR